MGLAIIDFLLLMDLQFQFYLKETIVVVVLITAIVASVTYKYYIGTPPAMMMPFLWFTFVIEVFNVVPYINYFYPNGQVTLLLKKILPAQLLNSSIFFGSVFSITCFYVYLFFFKKLLTSKPLKQVIMVFIVVYTVFAVKSMYNYEQLFISWFQSHMHIGIFFTLLGCLIYLYSILKSDKIELFYKTLPFWLSLGIVFFYLLTGPIFIFGNKLNFSHKIYTYILLISCYIMYGSFITGFIIAAREARKKLSS